MNEPIIFGQPSLGDEEVELVSRTLRSSWIGQGPLVAEFERRLAAEVWSEHVVAVSSCTAALELALLGLGIGPGDEVITTPLTFVATVNAIQAVGATPVLADIDPETLLIETAAVEAAITERTRAILPVSFGGRPLDIERLLDLARARELFVVEDAAHSVGAVADGMPVGASRDPRLITCFSFYPNKNLASAEGGAISLVDDELAARLRSHRMHGLNVDAWDRYRERRHIWTLATMEGRKANWTDVQAAIALPQLTKLEGFIAAREFLAECYDVALGSIPAVRTITRPNRVSVSATLCTSIKCACQRSFATRSSRICAMRTSAPPCTIRPSTAIRSTGTSRPPVFPPRSGRPTSWSPCRCTRAWPSITSRGSVRPSRRRSIG